MEPKTAPPTNKSIELLMAAMQAFGISTEGLTFAYEETTTGYPGGSYQTRSICISMPPFFERYDADLTEKNPFVTAQEISRQFGIPRKPVPK